MTALRLRAARIFVRDLDAALAFYGRQLGLPLLDDGRPHGFCRLRAADGLDLVVETVTADAPADDQALVGRFTGLSFEVSDIAAEHARLAAAGVAFSGAPERQFWGGWLATLSDPAGNSLQLVQYPTGTS